MYSKTCRKHGHQYSVVEYTTNFRFKICLFEKTKSANYYLKTIEIPSVPVASWMGVPAELKLAEILSTKLIARFFHLI